MAEPDSPLVSARLAPRDKTPVGSSWIRREMELRRCIILLCGYLPPLWLAHREPGGLSRQARAATT
jgi:hypothetical protein